MHCYPVAAHMVGISHYADAFGFGVLEMLMKLEQSLCFEKKQWEAKQKWNKVVFCSVGWFIFVC